MIGTKTSVRRLSACALLIAANIAAWLWAWQAFAHQPALITMAFLAWAFGLRHGVDADHIVAIDNVVRKLMENGSRPNAAGFFFSLGHSTVVVLACVVIAATASAIQDRFAGIETAGGIIGTSVSSGFLILIALTNIVVLRRVWRSRRGGKANAAEVDVALSDRGVLARLFRPLFRLVTRSWHMYPLGFLFGLGFDTATEVGLLGIAASQAVNGLSVWQTLAFPALVHGRDGARRYRRRHAHGRRLRLGLYASPAETVVQPHRNRRIDRGRVADRRQRGLRPSDRSVPARRACLVGNLRT